MRINCARHEPREGSADQEQSASDTPDSPNRIAEFCDSNMSALVCPYHITKFLVVSKLPPQTTTDQTIYSVPPP